MSDPVKNVEIEDVLSSIRKLVADDARVAPPAQKPQPDRLILTPAQRVTDAPAAKRDGDDAETPDPVLLTDPVENLKPRVVEERLDNIPRDARLADFGEVEGAFPDLDDIVNEHVDAAETQEEDVSESSARLELGRLIEEEVAAALQADDHYEARPDPLVDEVDEIAEDILQWDDQPAFKTPLIEDESGNDVEADVDDVPPEGTGAAALDVPTPPLTLEDKVAALGRLVAREPQDFEEERDTPDADELTAVSEPMTWPDTTPVEDVSEDADPVFVHNAEPTFTKDAEPTFAEEEVSVAEKEASAVVRSETAWTTQETYSPTQPKDVPVEDQFETASEPYVDPVQEPAHLADGPKLPINPSAEQPLQIDEEMLREIVSDIVRQELQGTLGERITRNVRKLVRREIHRMLISQELE